MPTTLDILDAPQRFASFVPKMIAGDETRVLGEFQEWVRRLPR